MRKVIIWCSALVFEFLTCSDASAVGNVGINVDSVTVKNAKTIIENKLTELRKLAGDKVVKAAINKFYDAAKMIKDPQMRRKMGGSWMGSYELIITSNGEVKFKDQTNNSRAYHTGFSRIKEFLENVQKEIEQYKTQELNLWECNSPPFAPH